MENFLHDVRTILLVILAFIILIGICLVTSVVAAQPIAPHVGRAYVVTLPGHLIGYH